MLAQIDTESIRRSIDLRTFAERYTTLDGNARSAERHGACPVCGGDDRFYVARDYWGCRMCDMRSDVIGLVMHAEKVEFQEAVEMLTGEKLPERTPAKPVAHPAKEEGDDARRDYFRANAPSFAEAAHARLLGEDNPGAAYLRKRGIEADTWADYGLGYTDKPIGVKPIFERPCIVIPWYVGGKLTALRYRYLDAIHFTDEKGKARVEKAHGCAGSKTNGFVFGGQAMPNFIPANELMPQYRSLVLCEGELNAVSIHQVCKGAHVDVLCFGAQGQLVPPRIAEMTQQYRAVVVWMDEEEFVKKKLAVLEVDSKKIVGYWSTMQAPKVDANDHLQRGSLAGMMVRLLRKATPAEHQDKLQWDLEDGGLV